MTIDLDELSVRADALQEAGDPRGELIALQIARAKGEHTAAGIVREQALIAKHGKRWAGAIGAWFDEHVFEYGDFVGGRLLEQRGGYDALLADPAWPSIRVLVDPPFALSTPHVRALRGIDERYVWNLPKRLDELHLVHQTKKVARDKHVLITNASLAKLSTLGFSAIDDRVRAVFAKSKALEKITRLVIGKFDHHAVKLVAQLVKRPGALRVVSFEDREDGLYVELRRTKRGTFPTMIVRQTGTFTDNDELREMRYAQILDVAKAAGATSLRFDLATPTEIPPKLAVPLAAKLAKLPLEHALVPWARDAKATWGPTYRIWLWADLLDRAPAIEKLLRDQPYDRRTKTPHALVCERRGCPERLEIIGEGGKDFTATTIVLATERSPAELKAWFATLLEAAGEVTEGYLMREGKPIWLHAPIGGITRAQAKKIAGIEVVASKAKQTIIAYAATPDGVTQKHYDAMKAKLAAARRRSNSS